MNRRRRAPDPPLSRRWSPLVVGFALGAVACPAGNTDPGVGRAELPAVDEPSLGSRAASPPSATAGPSPSTPRAPTEAGLVSLSAGELFGLIRNGPRRGTVVNVWATWCTPCQQELPTLQAETRRLAGDGIGLLLVSVDEETDQPKIPGVLARYGIPGPYYVVRPPREEFKVAVHPSWSGDLPVSFLFEATGKGRYFWDGPVTTAVLRPILEQFLAEPATRDDVRAAPKR
jgi:thiol-disulfide isomerase/thioredoxin